jgi:hypothetical protein
MAMVMTELFSAYTDPFVYRRATTGIGTNGLIGNLGRLTQSVDIGATSLSVPALKATLNIDDQVTIFDKNNSEVVEVTAIAAIGDLIVVVTPTQAAHVARTVFCSDGTQGSLSDMIFNASSWLESITQQPRWLTTYTETLQAPSMRAAVDRNRAIIMRPRRFPLSTVSALSYQAQIGSAVPLDPTQCIVDSLVQTVAVPAIAAIGAQQNLFSLMPMGRTSPVWLTITYAAGYPVLPGYIVEAANCLTGSLLSDQFNPTGAAEMQMGKQKIVSYLRGDLSAKNALVKRAENLLRDDIERVM